MVESVYIESSVISYMVARPSRDVVITARQAITETWWRERRPEFELYISTLVVQEIGRGDAEAAERRLNAVEKIPLLATTSEAQILAEELLAQRAVPAKSEEDALHIGIAAAGGQKPSLVPGFSLDPFREEVRRGYYDAQTFHLFCPLAYSNKHIKERRHLS